MIPLLAKFERLASSPGGNKDHFGVNGQIDVTSILQATQVPTLVLHRKTDLVVPVALGRSLAQSIQGGKYIEYPEGDHGFWSGETDALLGDIEEFVTGNRDSSLMERERVLATVLFTDIVGSTRSAATMGDQRWRRFLDVTINSPARWLASIGGIWSSLLAMAYWRRSMAQDAPSAARWHLAMLPNRLVCLFAQASIRARSNCEATISVASRSMLPPGLWDNVCERSMGIPSCYGLSCRRGSGVCGTWIV